MRKKKIPDPPRGSVVLPPWFTPDKQWCCLGRRHWRVSHIHERACDLPVLEAPVAAFNHSFFPFTMENCMDMAMHIKAVMAADLNYPIILSASGAILDGRHRLVKALVEGRETIQFVRFAEDPPPDREDNL